jgi:hypothetical protein
MLPSEPPRTENLQDIVRALSGLTYPYRVQDTNRKPAKGSTAGPGMQPSVEYRVKSSSVNASAKTFGMLSLEFFGVTCYVMPMATTPKKAKKAKPRTPQQRMASRRERLRAQGLRPVQHWVPDLRDPKVLAEIRREGAMLSKHPDDAAIDDWLDTIRDPEDWS